MEQVDKTISVQADGLAFTFLNSGDLREIGYEGFMVNQIMSNPLDGSMNNLYLRVRKDGRIQSAPLLGVRSGSKVSASDRRVRWTGEALGVSYRVTFTLMPGLIWFWEVALSGEGVEADVLYGQDVGLADKGAVRTNEAYMSQYVGHTAFRTEERGYAVCSRQNQPMSTGFPYLQQGSLTGSAGYSTDGFQFFGLSYKETDVPEALGREHLANKVYQYEFAYTALQSEKATLGSGETAFVFYGLLKPDHAEAIGELEYAGEIENAWEGAKALKDDVLRPAGEPLSWNERFGPPLQADGMTEREIEALFPGRLQEEREGGELLSFFTDKYEHVVLKAKELRMERPHGHIVMSGDNARINDRVVSSTNYMYGLFHSQITVGNTSFNKLMTNARNALNVLKTSGQRIYVEIDGRYRLLTLPSLYELGFNYARWHYKIDGDLLRVTAWTSPDAPDLALEAVSREGKTYRFLVTNQITMNDKEYELPFRMEREDGGELIFRADPASLSSSVYPELHFRLGVSGADMQVLDETALAAGALAGSASLVVLELEPTAKWRLTIQGRLEKTPGAAAEQGGPNGRSERPAEADIEAYRDFLASVMNGFGLSHDSKDKKTELEKFNALAWWYTHNMLVHYSVPHGLEQYSGAAWGTRDVCQGPTEYFLAMGKFGQVKEILKTVYSHQYIEEGNWPQWFMFDRYYRIQQEESHGDVIVWPLKVLGDYLRMTGDYALLDERVPYTGHGGELTAETYTVLDHARKEIQYMKDHFLHGTRLSSYGDGDWDDTLQPANAKLKQFMISSWTVSLTFQTFTQLARALAGRGGELAALAAELGELAEGIEEDFNRYLVKDGVTSGFAYMEEPGAIDLMLHPDDDKTGIRYRLLPMTRSMIGELFDKEQAESHYRLIKQELLCPDGVRLMNRPADYAGGVSTRFKRAEQAANFGREIGLQYVHAHIRFIEAMAKLGKTEETWKALETINPVGIRDVVPNADIRQSNAYFSSSDGKFDDRYEAAEGFGKLRAGEVQVKGGWRIYSSGPGIYMNQLISNVLGIRQEGGGLVLDPVLPADLDGLCFRFGWMGKAILIRYAVGGESVCSVTVNGVPVETAEQPNRYRRGGVRIAREKLEALLAANRTNEIAIVMA
ncbi:GH36-type glycosyl hydrolase domain-containing protein [Paenibacillus arenilitoris]|uniref:Cellobiose phosphorylase n=1 Tax=Paenibacillus arenilitoris TaxID=2772299 RepID=A0A927H980_9BACL|nr:glycosyl hydrolase family 65 protein [Paenibacillus arenilitoris]MBD2872463.1 cellobiose phosphorylase [Paenibacillus arenilitoris]